MASFSPFLCSLVILYLVRISLSRALVASTRVFQILRVIAQDGLYLHPQQGNLIINAVDPGSQLKIKPLRLIQDPGVEALT